MTPFKSGSNARGSIPPPGTPPAKPPPVLEGGGGGVLELLEEEEELCEVELPPPPWPVTTEISLKFSAASLALPPPEGELLELE
jgi:hypothetical protein